MVIKRLWIVDRQFLGCLGVAMWLLRCVNMLISSLVFSKWLLECSG